MKTENNFHFKILFQTTNPNLFRNTFIGYLYEIAQKHKVVLLAEGIDSYTKQVLGDKNLFPGLEKIIFIEPPFYGDIFRKNYRLLRTLKGTVREHKPDIVIATNDIWPAEMYLMKIGKRSGAATVAIQSGFKIDEKKKLHLFSCLTNSYIKMPRFLPFFIRLFLVKIKKYFGHFLYYWILPLTAGEMPFLGKTSFVFWDESPGLRDADYSAVFSKRDYDLHIKDGVPPEKLFILNHPLENKSTKKFFEKVYFSEKTEKANPKTLTIMWPDEKIGFRQDNYSLISEEKIQGNRAKIIELINKNLGGWKIFIKPHPRIKSVEEIKKIIASFSDNIFIADPSEPADKYIEMSTVIVGMPPSSTTLFTALLQCPEKIILSLDLNREFLGDSYRDFSGIKYINSEKEFVSALELIRDNKYCKKPGTGSNPDFSGTNELLDYVYARHLKTSPSLKSRRTNKQNL